MHSVFGLKFRPLVLKIPGGRLLGGRCARSREVAQLKRGDYSPAVLHARGRSALRRVID